MTKLTANPLIIEWHICLGHDQPAHTLLTVSRGKFVSQLGSSCLTQQNLQELCFVFRVRNHDLVHICSQRVFVGHGGILPGDTSAIRYRPGSRRGLLVDVDPPWLKRSVCSRQAVRFNHLIAISILVDARCRFDLWRIGESVISER